MLEEKQISPAKIMSLTTAYWDSQAFMTTNRLGIFSLLGEGSKLLSDICSQLGIQERQTRLLLNACVSLGLLLLEEDRYSNTAMSDHYLVPGKLSYLGSAVNYSDNLYGVWGNLDASVSKGQAMLPAEDYTGKDEKITRDFVYGMHNRALGIGAVLVELIDIGGAKKMLDIGGGPGTYSALFTQRYPELRATILDLPGVVTLAKDILKEMHADEKVSTLSGDFHQTEFPDGNDFVLISGVFHRESKDGCRSLIERAVASLNQGGVLAISDVFTDTGGTSPTFATMFGLNMMLTAPEGGVHADTDVEQWMVDAGLMKSVIKAFPAPMPHRVVYSKKT